MQILVVHSLVDVDLTKIKSKSLAGSDLTEASFAQANLSGVNLSEAILFGNNWMNTNFTGTDFTVVSNASILRGIFLDLNPGSNSNFEGVDLSPKKFFTTSFKNKADLKNLYHDSSAEIAGVMGTHSWSLVQDLFADTYCSVTNNIIKAECANVRILHTEVKGNDLEVNWTFVNTFALSNLENANFKNADLRFADFRWANLTNANLSGADLRKVFLIDVDLSNANLGGANLGGANLEGANLEGAILDNIILTYKNLKCVNHPICES